MSKLSAEELLQAVRAGYVAETHPDVAVAKAVLGREAEEILSKKPWDNAVNHCVAGCAFGGRRR